ncbi:DUF4238 domain-containing protein [Nitrospinota bacterium]
MSGNSYKRNHYVPQWYQKRFIPDDGRENKFYYLDLQPDEIPNVKKTRRDLLRWGPKRCFIENDLYTVKFGGWENVDIEKFFFGRVDRDGEKALEYFTNFKHPSVDNDAFHAFMNYMSVQKLRTPKGLGLLSQLCESENRNLDLITMQQIQNLYCAMWTECIWQIADASESKTKFIISDHPVTVYNRQCSPLSEWCKGYSDPDIRLVGTHTIFPLSPDKVMILTNLSWVRNPYQSELEVRPNPEMLRGAIFNFMDIQTNRMLSEIEVQQTNFIIKRRALRYVAAAEKEWLYPEKYLVHIDWTKIGEGYLFMPDPRSINLGGEVVIGYEDGRSDAYSEYGHKPWQSGFRDDKRREAEAETLHAFQGEFARLYGPKRRGRSFCFSHLDKEEDSPDFHDLHLEYDRKYRDKMKHWHPPATARVDENPKIRIGRNENCPCRSGRKYKQCCLGKVDWPHLLSKDGGEWMRYLSVRGRNMLFVNNALEILQSDTPPKSLPEYKAAFTPQAVKEISEVIVDLWPFDTDITSVLQSSNPGISGLYVGDYSLERLARAVVQHSLYADKILLIDPFIYPYSVRKEYNPILHPEKYCTQTLLNMNIWLTFAPWVEKGVVEFIRSPANFDPELNWKLLQFQKEKFENIQELKSTLKASVKQMADEFKESEGFRYTILMQPDSYLRKEFQKLKMGDKDQEEEFIQYIRGRRESDPNYLEPTEEVMRGGGELHMRSSGVGYEEAKIISNITGSYLMTDLPIRWKEIELDRTGSSSLNEWSPLSKSFQDLDLKFLNNVEMDHALKLRDQGRLDSFRSFMRKVWKLACSGMPYGEKNVQLLADELERRVREAEGEWKQIERDLMEWVGAEVEQMISPGNASFFAAGFVVAGATSLVTSKMRKIGLADKYPAAFSVNLKKN